MGKPRFLFISPHLDDAVLSCGGFIGKLCDHDFPVTVLTLFSGSPQERLSLLARALHADWRLPKDAPAIRRDEDLEALTLLGAKPIHADFLDCIYRRDPESGKPVYQRLAQILGQETVKEQGTITVIAEYLADMITCRRWEHVYIPLAQGGHIDHRIVHAAMLRVMVRAKGIRFHFYEDLPYTIDDPPDASLRLTHKPYHCVTPGGEKLKYEAMAKYASQVRSPRYSGGIDIEAIIAYGLQIGIRTGALAERVWLHTGN